MIIVTRELYDESDRDSRPNRMAFQLRFPDGTGCWSHNTANVAARINEYRAATNHPVNVSWRIADIACPVQVDGTKPAVEREHYLLKDVPPERYVYAYGSYRAIIENCRYHLARGDMKMLEWALMEHAPKITDEILRGERGK